MPKQTTTSRAPAAVAGTNGTVAHAPKDQPVLRLPVWAYLIALVGIIVSLVASGGLAYQHLSGHALPGCGGGAVKVASGGGEALGEETHQSACATLEAHPMGSLGGIALAARGLAEGKRVEKVSPRDAVWPVSFLGATYFTGALVAWIVLGIRGRRVPAILPWLVRLGALTSVGYLIVIVVSQKFCPYCITSHAGNLALWLCTEIGLMNARSLSFGGWRWDRAWAPVVAGIAVFAVTSGALAVLETNRREEMFAADAAESARTKKELEARVRAAQEQAAKSATQGTQEKAPWGPPNGFRGRWLLGPKETPVRVVMLTDFQCPDCRAFEGQLMAAYDKYPGKISISVVHFPMCSECNPYVSKTMHVNACNAARAAEAVAKVAGATAALEGKDEWAAANEAFWKTAKWLFEVKAEFDEASLRAKLPELGVANADAVIKMWQSPATLKLVQDDAKWGEVLGLFYTPMMFVNGVEVRGWLTNPMVLTQQIEETLKLNPPATDARNDNPPLVGQKYFDDWKLSPRVSILPGNPAYVKKTPGAKVDVVVFGDLCEPGTKELDAALMSMIGKKPFNYAFRFYPVNSECNPGVDNRYPQACLAAKAVAAAGIVGGPDAWFNMKDLMFQRQSSISPTMVGMAAGVVGVDQTKFNEALNGPAGVAVQNDVMAGKGKVTRFIPTLFVDGKYVERWKREGDNVLERILDYAVEHPGE